MTAKSDGFGSVACRLAKNHYDVDEDNSHIHVNQDIARGTGTGKLLVRVCPAHVYSEESDGTISQRTMPDYLHLSPAGYRRWAEAIEPKLKELGI